MEWKKTYGWRYHEIINIQDKHKKEDQSKAQNRILGQLQAS
jgi:hypothetical protein